MRPALLPALCAIASLSFAGPSLGESGSTSGGPPSGLPAGGAAITGAVYTMTNSASSPNEVLVFHRLTGGALSFGGAYETGGAGSGDGLGNQGGVVLSDDGHWLLVVNAGSDELSLFGVTRRGLVLRDTAPTGGRRPISVAVHQNLAYVVHAGGAVGDVDSLTALTIDPSGSLTPLPSSSRPLSAASTGPAQVGFSPSGDFVVVTEKGTSLIDVFPLDQDGYAGLPTLNASSGQTPFAFSFGPRGLLVVSEVFGGAEDAGAVSSYRLMRDGSLVSLDPSVPNTETAPCWLVVTPGGRFAYTTNTPDDSLSGYRVGFDGRLELLTPGGRTGEPGPGTRPLDMDLSDDGRFLYTLNIGANTISAFRILPQGGLLHLGQFPGIPAGVNGLAAR